MDRAERDVRRMEGIICSMTPLERRKPELIKATRKRRIAAGAGVQVQEVNRLLNQFEQMQGMMKKMKGGGLMKMMKRMGGAGGGPRAVRLTPADAGQRPTIIVGDGTAGTTAFKVPFSGVDCSQRKCSAMSFEVILIVALAVLAAAGAVRVPAQPQAQRRRRVGAARARKPRHGRGLAARGDARADGQRACRPTKSWSRPCRSA